MVTDAPYGTDRPVIHFCAQKCGRPGEMVVTATQPRLCEVAGANWNRPGPRPFVILTPAPTDGRPTFVDLRPQGATADGSLHLDHVQTGDCLFYFTTPTRYAG
jgi:hypothetical protein